MVVGMGRGGQSSRADHWSDISSWQGGSGGFVLSEDSEDPFPYQDEEGNYHAILHNLEGPHMVGSIDGARVGIHAFSQDGERWLDGGLAYTSFATHL